MSHDKQDKKIVQTRSPLGTASFAEMRRLIGVDVNPDEFEDESGTPTFSKEK